MSREIDEVKFEVASATRILSHMGLATAVTAALGHVSMRVPNQPDLFVVKGRGYEIDALDEMQYYDMIVCDLEGYKVDGPARSTQCSEVKIHSCIYRERPDMHSVVHVHPRHVVLMTVLGQPILPMCQEGALDILGTSHFDGLEVQTQRTGRPLHLFEVEDGARGVRIPEQRQPGEPGHDFTEQLQQLGTEARVHGGHAGDISAGVREARNQPGADRIGAVRHHDRDGLRVLGDRRDRTVRGRHDHAHLEAHQFPGVLVK